MVWWNESKCEGSRARKADQVVQYSNSGIDGVVASIYLVFPITINGGRGRERGGGGREESSLRIATSFIMTGEGLHLFYKSLLGPFTQSAYLHKALNKPPEA